MILSRSCSLRHQCNYKRQTKGTVSGSDKTATDTTTLKGKYTESLTFSTPNCIYADYGKFGKPSLQARVDTVEPEMSAEKMMMTRAKYAVAGSSSKNTDAMDIV